MEDKVISPEKAEEAKLKARYPHLGQKPGGSDFLRKRLQKGVSLWGFFLIVISMVPKSISKFSLPVVVFIVVLQLLHAFL